MDRGTYIDRPSGWRRRGNDIHIIHNWPVCVKKSTDFQKTFESGYTVHIWFNVVEETKALWAL